MRYSGFGYGDRPGQSAKDVAKAFYEGRYCKRSNCWTDGEVYYLYDNEIAQRIDIPSRVARKLTDTQNERDAWTFPTVRVCWGGHDTKTTARHLKALGFDAQSSSKSRGTPTLINGKAAWWWVTAEDLEAQKLWEPEPPKPKTIYYPQRERFINMTGSLFA